jgi:hypothetical protein
MIEARKMYLKEVPVVVDVAAVGGISGPGYIKG